MPCFGKDGTGKPGNFQGLSYSRRDLFEREEKESLLRFRRTRMSI